MFDISHISAKKTENEMRLGKRIRRSIWKRVETRRAHPVKMSDGKRCGMKLQIDLATCLDAIDTQFYPIASGSLIVKVLILAAYVMACTAYICIARHAGLGTKATHCLLARVTVLNRYSLALLYTFSNTLT